MAKVQVEEEIASSAGAVWELARDFGGIQRWSPGLTSCEVDREGVGAIRTIKMGTITIRERLEKLDDAARTFSYSMIEGPVPAEKYFATFAVSDAGPGKAQVNWGSTFEPKGAPEADLVALFESVYKSGIDGLRKALS